VVRENTGVECVVVGSSVNIDLNRPRRRLDADWPLRPLRIAAMIRPSTQRRNPKLTMEVLRDFYRAHGETVEIILFGCESSDPDFLALPRDFPWRNAGRLTRPQVAALLNEVDIFTDFSEFQAMGLTALEAMACGAAVIVPQKGGAESFAIHNQNALVVDTSSPAACLESLERLTMDEGLRTGLQQQGLTGACQYYPERVAYNMLKALFPVSL
jgi:glycosyltransferase involved in cell wall biosynthesis